MAVSKAEAAQKRLRAPLRCSTRFQFGRMARLRNPERFDGVRVTYKAWFQEERASIVAPKCAAHRMVLPQPRLSFTNDSHLEERTNNAGRGLSVVILERPDGPS
jgi:hypothetical protein